MADISIQFHALPEELVPFAKQFAAEFNLHLTAMRFFPFEAIEVESNDLDKLVLETASVDRRFAFTLKQPDLPVTSGLNFADRNPDHLRLDIGRMLTKGLEQSWLTCRTSNQDALAVWKIAAKRLKQITKAGVIAVNPETGAIARMRSFRYTTGAKTLETQGVVMLPPGDGSVLKFE